jgi:hypothetical protein
VRAAAALVAVLATFGPAAWAAPVPRRPDRPAYRLSLNWTPATHTLAGVERIAFRNPGPDPLTAIWLRVWPNGWRPVGSGGSAAGCGAPRTTIAVTAGGTIGARAADCSAYRIDLGAAVAAGATGSVTLDFTTRVPTANDRFGTAHGISNIGNGVPILAVQDARGWHLEPYTATGESFYSLSGSWDATITAPAGIAVASTGAVVRNVAGPGGVTTTVHSSGARDFALVLGVMRVQRFAVGRTTVRVFTAPGMAARTRRSVNASARLAMTYYPAWFGPYGSRELDVVAAAFTTFGGMEYPELVMTDVQRSPVVHEIAHQWFYGIVGNDQWREPWLDESFASYAEQLLAGGFPCDARAPVPRIPGFALDSTMAAFDRNTDEYGQVVYYGGACALRDLEHHYGRRRFLRLLRRYVADHRFGVATAADFVSALAADRPTGFSIGAWKKRSRIVHH